MKRLARRLFTLCSAVSLVLCVAACALWARGLGRAENAILRTDRFNVTLSSGNGLVRVSGARDAAGPSGWETYSHVGPRGLWDDWTAKPNRWGFGLKVGRTVGPPRGGWKHGGRTLVTAYLPQWLIVPAAALLPGAWVWRFVRTRRRNIAGLCTNCGYDLRATPGRCPECGATASATRSSLVSR